MPPVKPSSSSAAAALIAEYAKSARATCKTCTETIPAKALRLGVVTKDQNRGFDMTRWHHFHCLSVTSFPPVTSVDSIKGFSSLNSGDQDALKKLVEDSEKVKDKGEDEGVEDVENSSAEDEVRRRDDDLSEGEETTKRLKKDQLPVSEDVNIEMKDKYKDATLLPKWNAFQTIIFLSKDDGLQDSSKIAAFDFDGCLANTDVKRSGANAWSLMYESIPDKLQKLYSEGYKLVIFTNESNIDRWKNKRQKAVDSKIGRLSNFIKLVKVPIQVFIACGFDQSGCQDPYRKPKSGMWHVMEKHFNSDIPVDMDQSFYVGDAAGRKGDHSDADIKFAQAIGLKFYLPEEYFLEARCSEFRL